MSGQGIRFGFGVVWSSGAHRVKRCSGRGNNTGGERSETTHSSMEKVAKSHPPEGCKYWYKKADDIS